MDSIYIALGSHQELLNKGKMEKMDGDGKQNDKNPQTTCIQGGLGFNCKH